ncbi:MAG: hypothetical protein EOP22_01455 [Hyphomicrobiales bacterium]|nr:MAG: hypothetical protein EOP22_01455 [Hyphomicrobiales bacterium]
MPSFDYAIFGSNLLSGFLAGILAAEHGKKVVRVGRRPSARRLPRQLDLALPFSARPETWDLVSRTAAETHKLLLGMGAPEGWSATDVAWLADSAATTSDVDHAIHLAHGIGHQVARLDKGWALRRVPLLHPEFLGDTMAKWLSESGVVSQDEGPADAAQMVLADDVAIAEQLPAGLATQAMTATLLAAPRALPFPLDYFPDRGVTLLRRPGNAVLALVSGESEIEARLASTLSGPFPLKRLATTRYRRVITDGAPMIGRMGEIFVIAGLGEPAAFLAPPLARLLAGSSEGRERDWFATHDPAQPRDAVADLRTVVA